MFSLLVKPPAKQVAGKLMMRGGPIEYIEAGELGAVAVISVDVRAGQGGGGGGILVRNTILEVVDTYGGGNASPSPVRHETVSVSPSTAVYLGSGGIGASNVGATLGGARSAPSGERGGDSGVVGRFVHTGTLGGAGASYNPAGASTSYQGGTGWGNGAWRRSSTLLGSAQRGADGFAGIILED